MIRRAATDIDIETRGFFHYFLSTRTMQKVQRRGWMKTLTKSLQIVNNNKNENEIENEKKVIDNVHFLPMQSEQQEGEQES